MRRAVLGLALMACLLLISSAAAAWQGLMTEVKEANTLVVRTGGKERTVHLYGIGLPEGDEPFAEEARRFVRSTALRQRVEVERMATGSPLRAMVTVQGDGESLNAKILRQGLGWVREAYCEKARLCGELTRIKGEARREQRNLWAEVPGNKAAWRWVQEQDKKP